jgi:hypothetical protein
MNSTRPSGSKSTTDRSPQISSTLLVGVATVPVLAGIVVGKALAQVAQELGSLSEELFRGDRLPLLQFPAQSDAAPDSSQRNE